MDFTEAMAVMGPRIAYNRAVLHQDCDDRLQNEVNVFNARQYFRVERWTRGESRTLL